MTLVAEAFAKVNRALVVRGRRPDGYHDLDTVFETIDLTDRLRFEESSDVVLAVDDPAIPSGTDNLVLRAAEALRRAAGVARGASITLEKRIPAGGGLGGGSSDAAVTLAGLVRLWDLDVGPERLAGIAATLGADVPFFLTGGRARGTGRGDRIEPLPDAPPTWFVVLIPPFGCPTPDVFRALDAGPAQDAPADAGLPPERNDLEPAAESLRPELGRMRAALLEAGALASRLSGSGSTVYGVFPDRPAAERGAARVHGLPEFTRIRVVSSVSREEFRKRSEPRPET